MNITYNFYYFSTVNKTLTRLFFGQLKYWRDSNEFSYFPNLKTKVESLKENQDTFAVLVWNNCILKCRVATNIIHCYSRENSKKHYAKLFTIYGIFFLLMYIFKIENGPHPSTEWNYNPLKPHAQTNTHIYINKLTFLTPGFLFRWVKVI